MKEVKNKGLDALFDKVFEDVQNTRFNFNIDEEKLKWYDQFQTEEQSIRDKEVTRLFKLYVDNYEEKIKHNTKYKEWILLCSIGIIALILLFGGAISWELLTRDEKGIVDLASLIIAFGGIFTTAIGIFKIVTEYVFPKDEESYITAIVKSIQENDLENKKVNISTSCNDLNDKKQA